MRGGPLTSRPDSKHGGIAPFCLPEGPNAGLIELDDALPKEHDPDALEIGLTVALMFEMHPVTHLQTMRKTVVDGSNTSGFQRTTLLATHGCLRTEDGDVGIDVLCLEEDSARKLRRDRRTTARRWNGIWIVSAFPCSNWPRRLMSAP